MKLTPAALWIRKPQPFSVHFRNPGSKWLVNPNKEIISPHTHTVTLLVLLLAYFTQGRGPGYRIRGIHGLQIRFLSIADSTIKQFSSVFTSFWLFKETHKFLKCAENVILEKTKAYEM
jgi:hypothetical protein